MKLALQMYDNTITIENPNDDLTPSQVVEFLLRPALRAAGYADKSIEAAIGTVDESAFD